MTASHGKKHGVLTDANSIRFERLLPGPLELVWDYLTRKELLSTWLVDDELEQRVGADVSLSQASDRLPIRSEGEIRGIVTRCEPPRLLAYTWRFVPTDESPDAETLRSLKASEVTFELEERGEQVLLTLTHSRVPSNHIPQAGAGWHAHLEFLVARMTGREARAFFTNYERVLPDYVRAQRRKQKR